MAVSREYRFVVCIRNDEYPASLETRKIYQVLHDADAAKHHQLRVIDESGEDYLYPEAYFVAIKLTKATERALVNAA